MAHHADRSRPEDRRDDRGGHAPRRRDRSTPCTLGTGLLGRSTTGAATASGWFRMLRCEPGRDLANPSSRGDRDPVTGGDDERARRAPTQRRDDRSRRSRPKAPAGQGALRGSTSGACDGRLWAHGRSPRGRACNVLDGPLLQQHAPEHELALLHGRHRQFFMAAARNVRHVGDAAVEPSRSPGVHRLPDPVEPRLAVATSRTASPPGRRVLQRRIRPGLSWRVVLLPIAVALVSERAASLTRPAAARRRAPSGAGEDRRDQHAPISEGPTPPRVDGRDAPLDLSRRSTIARGRDRCGPLRRGDLRLAGRERPLVALGEQARRSSVTGVQRQDAVPCPQAPEVALELVEPLGGSRCSCGVGTSGSPGARTRGSRSTCSNGAAARRRRSGRARRGRSSRRRRARRPRAGPGVVLEELAVSAGEAASSAWVSGRSPSARLSTTCGARITTSRKSGPRSTAASALASRSIAFRSRTRCGAARAPRSARASRPPGAGTARGSRPRRACRSPAEPRRRRRASLA